MKNKIIFNNDWDTILFDELRKPYFKELMGKLSEEYQKYKVYPPYHQIFNALKYTPFNNIKVVLLGQDPYHQPNQANGLCFSVSKDSKIPKSLHNIFLELSDDLNVEYPKDGDLSPWAKQGVLLLNTVMTVRDSHPRSHRNMGWEKLTNKIITLINNKKEPIVFLLWGNDAKEKERLISSHHMILKSVHPSPLSAHRGFFGCHHFSQTNEFLLNQGIQPINWNLNK